MNARSLPPPLAALGTEPIAGPRRHKITAEQLLLGLFVVDLDRPWLDTPFLIQGFLVDSQVELTTLQKYCHHVFVDLDMSNPDAVAQLRRDGEGLCAPTQPGPREVYPPHSRGFSPSATRNPPDSNDREPTGEHSRPERDRTLRETDPHDHAPTDPDAALRDADRALEDFDPMPMSDEPAQVDHEVNPPTLTGRQAESGPPARRTAQRAYRVRSDVQISTDTRDRFRRFVRQTAEQSDPVASRRSMVRRVFDSLRGLMPGRPGTGGVRQDGQAGAQEARFDLELEKALPPGTKRQVYQDRHEVAREMPRARQTFESSESILTTLLTDIRQNKVPQVAQVKETVGHMVSSMIDNPDALMWVAQLREEHLQTYQHGVRVSLYMISLGRHLGFPKEMLESLGLIGMLADVGKTKLPRALLDKPGMLNTAEYSIAKEHVRLGLEALGSSMKMEPDVVTGILQHHERLDGSGYPKGLKGDEISIYGRMAGIADSFAALITPRPYANPLAPQDALMSLYQWAGSSFHAPLVEQFVQAVGVFPVGGLVELSTGEVAVVLAHNRVRRLEPRVLILTMTDKRPLTAPIERDLFQQSREPGAKPMRIVRGLPSGAYGLKLRDYYADEPAALAKH